MYRNETVYRLVPGKEEECETVTHRAFSRAISAHDVAIYGRHALWVVKQ